MRRSRILLGALAVVAGVLIGFGNPKEVKAVDEIEIEGNVDLSSLPGDKLIVLKGSMFILLNKKL